MSRYFPSFRLQKGPDGRLSWNGQLTPGMLQGWRRTYTLRAIYDHNHPHNDSYGGSIKLYCVDPDLSEISGGEAIPHTLRDSQGKLYLCTSRSHDFTVTEDYTLSAASAIGWAAKWIAAFELWLDGRITMVEFAGHNV